MKTQLKKAYFYKGFTLLELVIVLGVLAVLGVVVTVLINPTERYRETSDTKRMSELKTLTQAISVYRASGGSLSGVSSTIVYTSLPDTDDAYPEECDEYNLPSLPSGYTYYCSLKSNFRKVSGSGWVPLNLSQQLSVLPVDPTNNQYQYYTFTSDRADYEITAVLNSSKYTPMMASDGGDNNNLYEKGSKLTLSTASSWQIAKNYPENQTIYTPSLFGDKIVYAAGAAGQAAFFINADHIIGNNSFYWDDTNERLGIGTTYPKGKLDVAGGVSIGSYAGNNTPPSNGMIISGNVGIGTTGPGKNLEVYGASSPAIRVNNSDNSNSAIELYNVSNLGAYFKYIENSGQTILSAVRGGAGSHLQLRTQDVERVRIDAAGVAVGTGYIGTAAPSNGMIIQGNVGIGTTGPNYLLSLGTTLSQKKLAVYDSSATNFYGLGVTTDAGGELTFGAGLTDVVTAQMVLTNLGNVGIGTTGPGYTLTVNGTAWVTSGAWSGSDIRWKKDITPLPLQGSLDKVIQLNPVSFDWRTNEFPNMHFSSSTQLGFIGQDVEEIIPEVVTTDNNGYKGISYERITPMLTAAIQEQQKQIEELKSENEKLESRVKFLENR